MQLTEIRINVCALSASRLKAFCALTFDNTFVVRDVKLIERAEGLFLAMPSRKLCDRCPHCGEKNHLRAHFCNQCGARLNEQRFLQYQDGNTNGHNRLKLHADIAHPIHADCRQALERRVIDAYHEELQRSRRPGYVPPKLDGDDLDFYDVACEARGPDPAPCLRPMGTTPR